jgi:hypothetical protein
MGEKSEARNPKSETDSNVQNPKFKTTPLTGTGVLVIRAWNLGFVSDLVLRISDFRPGQSRISNFTNVVYITGA